MSDLNTEAYWSAAYAEDRDHWDLNGPTPVFVDLLQRSSALLPGIVPEQSRVFVPCSGRGYDALLFARHGFSVTAVDISALPLRDLERDAAAQGLSLSIVHGDMFRLPPEHADAYDICLEYTCFCAVAPSRRGELVDVYWHILKPGGYFLGLIFPIDPRPGGPPFSIDPEEFSAMMRERFIPVRDEFPAASIKPRAGKEMLAIWRKPPTADASLPVDAFEETRNAGSRKQASPSGQN
jgi:methyl halide transferase